MIATALRIIHQNGSCDAIECEDCPIAISQLHRVAPYLYGGCPAFKSVRKQNAILYLIHKIGEQKAKELIVEVLI